MHFQPFEHAHFIYFDYNQLNFTFGAMEMKSDFLQDMQSRFEVYPNMWSLHSEIKLNLNE